MACEYSLFFPLLAAWNVSPASQAAKSVRAKHRSKPCEDTRASEAARGQRNPFSPPPPLSRLLSRASRASTFHDITQMESLLAGDEERGETQCFLLLELTNIDCSFRGTPMCVVKTSVFVFLGKENKQKLYFRGYTLHPLMQCNSLFSFRIIKKN